MWENESVLSYGYRVKEISDKIYDAHKINNNGQLDKEFLEGIERSSVQCFLRGLKPELEIRVKEGLLLQ